MNFCQAGSVAHTGLPWGAAAVPIYRSAIEGGRQRLPERERCHILKQSQQAILQCKMPERDDSVAVRSLPSYMLSKSPEGPREGTEMRSWGVATDARAKSFE